MSDASEDSFAVNRRLMDRSRVGGRLQYATASSHSVSHQQPVQALKALLYHRPLQVLSINCLINRNSFRLPFFVSCSSPSRACSTCSVSDLNLRPPPAPSEEFFRLLVISGPFPPSAYTLDLLRKLVFFQSSLRDRINKILYLQCFSNIKFRRLCDFICL